MPKEIIRQVADYCWSNDFLNIFRTYFKDHAHEFIDAPPLQGGEEHNLRYYSLFMDYLAIYEGSLTKHLNGLDCSIEEFYKDVKAAQHEDNDEYLQYFIDCLLASADYESFYKVMSKHGKLKKASSKADAKADAKPISASAGAAASKKGTDDDEEVEDQADAKGGGGDRRGDK